MLYPFNARTFLPCLRPEHNKTCRKNLVSKADHVLRESSNSVVKFCEKKTLYFQPQCKIRIFFLSLSCYGPASIRCVLQYQSTFFMFHLGNHRVLKCKIPSRFHYRYILFDLYLYHGPTTVTCYEQLPYTDLLRPAGHPQHSKRILKNILYSAVSEIVLFCSHDR